MSGLLLDLYPTLSSVIGQFDRAMTSLQQAITPAEVARCGQAVERALDTVLPEMVQQCAEQFEQVMATKLSPHIKEAAPDRIRAACRKIHGYVATCLKQQIILALHGATDEALQLLRDFEDLVLWLSKRMSRFDGFAAQLGVCREVMLLPLRYCDLLEIIRRLQGQAPDLQALVGCIMATNAIELSQENVFMLDLDGVEIDIKRIGHGNNHEISIVHRQAGIVYRRLTWGAGRSLADKGASVRSQLYHYLAPVGAQEPPKEFRGLCDLLRACIKEHLRELVGPILLGDLQWAVKAKGNNPQHRKEARVRLQSYRTVRNEDMRYVLYRCMPSDAYRTVHVLQAVATPAAAGEGRRAKRACR